MRPEAAHSSRCPDHEGPEWRHPRAARSAPDARDRGGPLADRGRVVVRDQVGRHPRARARDRRPRRGDQPHRTRPHGELPRAAGARRRAWRPHRTARRRSRRIGRGRTPELPGAPITLGHRGPRRATQPRRAHDLRHPLARRHHAHQRAVRRATRCTSKPSSSTRRRGRRHQGVPTATALEAATRELHLEGVVAKRLDSLYTQASDHPRGRR